MSAFFLFENEKQRLFNATVAAIFQHLKFSNNLLMKRLLILIVTIVFIPTVFAQKKKLGFNLVVGKTYYQIMQSSSNIEQDIKGQKVSINLTISGQIAFNVTNLYDTIYDVSVSYHQLAMSMKLPNGDVSFNSDNKDGNDSFSKLLNAIIDKPFFVKMTTLGRIVEVKNIDSVFEKALDKFPKLSEAQKQQMMGQLMQAFGEKSFKGNFEMITAIYSNNPVEKGDTWIKKTNLETGMAATLIITFELKDNLENYNLIIGNGNIETLNKDAYTQANGMPTKYNLTGTLNSILKVDNKTGWIIEGKVNELISGTVEIKDNPNLPGGMSIPMSISAEITYNSK